MSNQLTEYIQNVSGELPESQILKFPKETLGGGMYYIEALLL